MQLPLKIALLDLNHTTTGLHTRTMPLGIGLIASYLLNNLPGKSVEVHLYKFTDDLENDWKVIKFNVVGFSMYTWNTNLNFFYANKLKKLNPSICVICGGPNMNYSIEWVNNFFNTHPFINYLVQYDGEVAFAKIVSGLLDKKTADNGPIKGTCYLDRNSQKVISNGPAKRLTSLDETPSPYLNGIMDKFFGNNLSPFIETNRGCPYSCTFCHTASTYYNKLIYAGLEKISEELEYFAKRLKDYPLIPLYIADNNFGMFNRDREVALLIRKMQDNYGWPVFLDTTGGKSRVKKMLETISILKPKTLTIAMSTQSMTPEVLKNIKRKNLEMKDFLWLQENSKVTKNISTSELIIGLPGETKESFFKTVATLIASGIDIITPYTLMKLNGTKLSDEINDNINSYTLKYRIVPKQFGEYDNNLIFDIEKVVVATPTMTFDDYMECRGLSFFLHIVYKNDAFKKVICLLLLDKCNVYDWIIEIMNYVRNSEGKPSKLFNAFIVETKNELWPSAKSIYDFFQGKDNYKKLLSGEYGENLLAKYSRLANINCFDEWLDIVIMITERYLENKKNDFKNILINLKYYLINTRSLGNYFYSNKTPQDFKIGLNYDFDNWDGLSVPKEYAQKHFNKYSFSGEAKTIFEKINDSSDKDFQIQLLNRGKGLAVLYPQLIQ